MKTLIVEKKHNNKKLSSFFMSSFENVPISVFYKLLRKKDIRINGNRIHEDCILHTGDEVVVYIQDSPAHKNIPIIYEDNNIVIINKPAGIEVTNNKNSLTSELKENYTYIEPCHRLDRNTSGLVVFAKNENSLNNLLNGFKAHEIKKFYACIVIGKMPKEKDSLDAFLFKDSKKSLVYISDTPKKGYLSITTIYKVLKYNKEKDLSLLDVELKTGRTHQIRAHLAHIGHPILGDGKYGINEINKEFNKKMQMLCAYELKFDFSSSNSLSYLNDINFKISFPQSFKIV